MNKERRDLRHIGLGVLSRQRAGLYAFAMLWIMLFHSTLGFSFAPLAKAKALGYAGVDMFFFLSGISLYYSMERDPSPERFCKKRFRRVLPPFLIVAVLYEGLRWVLGLNTVWDFLDNVSLMSLWATGNATYWFVGVILLYYLAYPLLYRELKRERYWLWVLLFLGAFLPGLVAGVGQRRQLYLFTGLLFRLPIFMAGCLLAPLVKRDLRLPTVPTLLLCLAGIVGCVALWNRLDDLWYLRLFVFVPLSVFLSLVLGFLLSLLPEWRPLRAVLAFLADITLEVYLLHERVLGLLGQYIFPNWQNTVELNGLAVLLTIASAWGLRKLCLQLTRARA